MSKKYRNYSKPMEDVEETVSEELETVTELETTIEETTETVKPQRLGRVNTALLNVRKGPSTTDEVIVAIPRDTRVRILEIIDEWYLAEIVHKDSIINGYVKKEFITS